MANGILPTGISDQPIDLVSGATAFSQAATEQRLADIESSKEEISENYKNILKASSIKAPSEISLQMQKRYNKKIDEYRSDIMQRFRESEGKLSADDQLEVQNRYVDLTQEMLTSVNLFKQFEGFRQKQYEKGFQEIYNTDAYQKELAGIYEDLNKGKDPGNINARMAQYLLPPTIPDYIGKRYGDVIDSLNVKKTVDIDGKLYTTMEGPDKDELMRVRDYILSDLNISNLSVPEQIKKEKLVEDYIERRIEEQKMIPSSYFNRGRTGYQPYVNPEPETQIVKTDAGDVSVEGIGNISATDVTPLVWTDESGESRKVAPEQITHVRVAKDIEKYKKKIRSLSSNVADEVPSGRRVTYPSLDDGFIYNDIVDEFDPSEYEWKTFLKVAMPKDKGIDFLGYDNLMQSGNKVQTKYIPFDKVSTAFYGKAGTKKEGYIEAVNALRSQLQGTESSVRQYTINGEQYTEEELRSAGWTDDDLNKLK